MYMYTKFLVGSKVNGGNSGHVGNFGHSLKKLAL